MPTLTALAQALATDLRPLNDWAEPTPLTGVHISELLDPTAFLAGGELLLTTGMNLTGHLTQSEAYVARLVDREIAALAFGLGPAHSSAPPSLVRACARARLPLFAVPVATPFMVVSREFWRQLAKEDTEPLNAALGAHRNLMRAATGPSPAPAVIRVLAGAVNGWAAFLSPTGEVEQVWPRSAVPHAAQAAAEVTRLHVAGPHSAATFPLDGQDVVMYPVSPRGRPRGYVVTACPRPSPGQMRSHALSAAALLELGISQDQQERARRTIRQDLLWLLLRGHVDAARVLAGDRGHEFPVTVRLCLIDPAGVDLVDDLPVTAITLPSGEVLTMWSEGQTQDLLDGVRTTAPLARSAAAGELPPAGVADAVPVLLQRLRRLEPGHHETAPRTEDPSVAALSALLAYPRADLVGTVAAVLRARGRIERAATELGLHRNTVRHRLGLATSVTGLDLDDPDTAARLWLLLRSRGLV